MLETNVCEQNVFRCQGTPRSAQLGVIHEAWITERVYLNIETLKEWKERKETPDQTRDEEMVL